MEIEFIIVLDRTLFTEARIFKTPLLVFQSGSACICNLIGNNRLRISLLKAFESIGFLTSMK